MNVSVIIPVYNAESFVETAVRSALEQPETIEVKLIEDGSDDASLAICERLAEADDRVHLLHHPGNENRGPAASRNLGIMHAEGDIVAFLDADDFFLPGRFERALEILAADEGIDGVYEAVGTRFESTEMRRWWTQRRGTELTTMLVSVPPARLLQDLISYEYGFFCTDGIVVRRSLFDRTGLFDVHLRMCQDTAMWQKMAAVGRLVGGRLDRPVAVRRMHGDNRIVTRSAEHPRYAREMAWTLLRWGFERRLDGKKLLLLADQVATLSQESARHERRSWLGQRSQDARSLIRLLITCPAALWSRPVWYLAGGLLRRVPA
jgi:glycosyltransferase involved in cell wall biosynthesis